MKLLSNNISHIGTKVNKDEIYRTGDVVLPFKMPRYKAEKKKEEKRTKQDDPAIPGSGIAKATGLPKYSDTPSLHSKFLMVKINECADKGLVEASFAKATWAKHCAAFNSIKKFEKDKNVKCEWPFTLENICQYVSWAINEKKLLANTVKSYLSSVKTVHELANVYYSGNSTIINAMLRGAENIERYSGKVGTSRKVMTLALLKLIGHQIANKDWSTDSKLTVWGTCLVAFFGALRFGEILSKKSLEFCPQETLLWQDIKFRKDGSVLLHVKIDKSKNTKGSYIDIFEFPNKNCCAVQTLVAMKKLKFKLCNPVFQFSNGKNLCASQMNEILYNLLSPVIGENASGITGHSFRAGLPAAMARNPDIAKDKDIKAWGRWNSDSYLLYTRLKIDQKRALFNKIVSVLLEK